ncbi:MAG: AI-2E family transporter [Elusimicrobiota bacterium]
MARRPPAPPLWTLAAAAVVLSAAYYLHDILVPFVLSLALAYLLNPVVLFFEVRGLRRTHLVLGLYLLVAAVLTAGANTLLPAISHEMALLQGKTPLYFTKMRDMLGAIQFALAQHMPFGQTVVEAWSLKLYEPIVGQIPKLPSYVLGLFPLFSLIFLVPFITFFLLLDSPRLLQKTIQICPSRYVEQTLHLLSEIDTSLGNYIRGILMIALWIGVVSYAGLKFLRVDYALAVATLAGLSSFIPYLGAIMGAAVGALVAFFQYRNFLMPFQVVMLFTGIRLADEAFLQPVVAKHSVHLHPLFFLLALMVGGKLFGFVGLIFAVPGACVIKALTLVAWDWYLSEAQVTPPQHIDGSEIPYI